MNLVTFWRIGFVLHTDLWPSRQSEILWTRRTCENKQNQSRGWMEICGCYEMKYADAYVRGHSVIVSHRLESFTRTPAGLRAPLRQLPTAGRRLSTRSRPRSRSAMWGLEDNSTWNGPEKENVWINMAVCICPPVSVAHTPTEALTPRRIKSVIFL